MRSKEEIEYRINEQTEIIDDTLKKSFKRENHPSYEAMLRNIRQVADAKRETLLWVLNDSTAEGN